MKGLLASKGKLTAVEYAWACWPLLLMFMGGALGGLCGGAAVGISVKIFNSTGSPAYKYFMSFVVSLGGIAAYLLAVAVLFHTFPSLGRHSR